MFRFNLLTMADMLLAYCRKEEDVDPEQIRKDIERLQLIKQKRLVCSLYLEGNTMLLSMIVEKLTI